MLSAVICGVLGSVACFVVGMSHFDFTGSQVLVCIVAANLGGFLGLLVTQTGERVAWAKRSIMAGGTGTWICFLGVYLSTIWLIGTPLRHWQAFLWMILPLIFASGFSIICFGPIQDKRVARLQRKSRLQK